MGCLVLSGVAAKAAFCLKTPTRFLSVAGLHAGAHCPNVRRPSTTTPPVSDFSNAVLAIALGITGTWATTLDGLSAAIDTLGALQGAANPLTSECALQQYGVQAVCNFVTQDTGSKVLSRQCLLAANQQCLLSTPLHNPQLSTAAWAP